MICSENSRSRGVLQYDRFVASLKRVDIGLEISLSSLAGRTVRGVLYFVCQKHMNQLR